MRTIKQLEEIVYSSDPFAVETLITKSKEDLQIMLNKLYMEMEKIPKHSSNWKTSHMELIELVEALIELRVHDEDGAGGISLV